MSTSVVEVFLDTRPPVLTITADKGVEPPNDWIVMVSASEPVGVVEVSLIDALGTWTNIGYELIDSRTLMILVPTPGVAAGLAKLRIIVADAVLNLAQTEVPVFIEGSRGFNVVLTIESDPNFIPDSPALAFNVGLTLGRGHEISSETFLPYVSETTLSGGN